MNDVKDTFLGKVKPELESIVDLLTKILMKIQPKYEIKKAWGGLGFKLDKNYSCIIVEYKDHIKLMIWRGVDLKDPKGTLEGKGINTKHLKFYSSGDIDRQYLKKLLDQQYKMYNSGISWE